MPEQKYYYLVVYADGTMGVYAVEQHPTQHQVGASIFQVTRDLTVKDISELNAIGNWENKENLPEHLKKKIWKVY